MPRLETRRRMLALGLAVVFAPARAQAFGLDELMRLLASRQTARASFTETRTAPFLERPLRSSGELRFSAPDHFEKRTLEPRAEDLVLDGDHLVIRSEGSLPMGVDLRSQPEAMAFVASIRGTLAGDLDTLRQVYAVSLSGSAARWSLELVPRQPAMAAVVARITIDGRGADLRRLVFDQSGGARTEMRIRPEPLR